MKCKRSTTRAGASALVFSALCALAASGAQAALVLYDQAPNQIGDLYLSTATAQNAETFTLGSAALISGFRWYGTLVGTGDFTVRLYSSPLTSAPDTYSTLSGMPAAALTRSANAVYTHATGGIAFPVYEYELTLASALAAAANQEYAVAIFANSTSWGWQDSTQGDGVSSFRGGDATAWQQGTPDLSLTVLGADAPAGVPEPTSLALAILALAAAATLRRHTT